ncbi:DUF4179 domain-containing protein [Anoxybacteroides tepidamans]|uniref:DUF4179 domain-containing protein n=1 Tax=Anoxybacteroides tepidamans TaxID=265948 RepID=UPI00048161DB|nr:DUF4179 domain-containing protein [Anoxybacillus tepidamans]
MSIFKELNHIKLDLSEFEEIALSNDEQKRILKQVKKKISSQKPKKMWTRAGITSVAVCALVLFFTIDKETIASMPFVGGIIEKYINPNETLNYSAYKTAIGETAENELGKLTLNEVVMDDRQLFLSATFEPAKDVNFDYRTHITPKVKINGKDYTIATGGQTVPLNRNMFMIYNDITLNQSMRTENLQIEVSYNTWNFDKKIEQPWTFRITASQAKLLEDQKAFELNKTIALHNKGTVTIQKVVATPISTTVYYDLSQSTSEDVYFKIQSADGALKTYSSAFTSNHAGDVSFVRFNGLTLEQTKYFLIAYDSKGHRLHQEPIPIN